MEAVETDLSSGGQADNAGVGEADGDGEKVRKIGVEWKERCSGVSAMATKH